MCVKTYSLLLYIKIKWCHISVYIQVYRQFWRSSINPSPNFGAAVCATPRNTHHRFCCEWVVAKALNTGEWWYSIGPRDTSSASDVVNYVADNNTFIDDALAEDFSQVLWDTMPLAVNRASSKWPHCGSDGWFTFVYTIQTLFYIDAVLYYAALMNRRGVYTHKSEWIAIIERRGSHRRRMVQVNRTGGKRHRFLRPLLDSSVRFIASYTQWLLWPIERAGDGSVPIERNTIRTISCWLKKKTNITLKELLTWKFTH